MNTNLEDYKIAQQIFYKLLKNGELTEKDNKELFNKYINENGVKEAISCIEQECKIKIVNSFDTIYLIPLPDNDIIGFKLNECNKKLGENNNEIYLSYLIMTIIFSEFTSEYAPASFLEIPNIITLVSESLERSCSKENIEEEEVNNSFNIRTSKKIWDSKIKWDESNEKGIKTTSSKYQIGYIRRIINFLVDQRLVHQIDSEDKIIPTKRFKDLMNCYFKDSSRKKEIEQLLSIKKEE